MRTKLYRNFRSQEEINLQYNFHLTIPDLGDWIDWYVRESETARRELDSFLDVRYGPTVEETLDIFPAKKAGAPVLVFIHGGYWVTCSSKDFSYVAKGFVDRGITVIVTNYALCPKVTVSEITCQNRAAIAWLYREGKNFNADPDRIFVAGHSAGGQQVGMLVSTDWVFDFGLPKDILKGGIPISGVFDLHPLRYSYLQPKISLTQEEILSQSPLFNIPASGPPLLVVYGEKETEELHRQSETYLQAWQANGLQGSLHVQKDLHHFSTIKGLVNPDSNLSKAIVDFVNLSQKRGSPRENMERTN